ncbi:LacI family DNA-binding transcriptional regulator [Streptomyces sp. 6N223]|uniref:LacI family DNA-binding transcriptional regulator n=1 Tax=Streptomyces sp. 6N223 TaxID=3457412 RepID=UPI003FD235DF
MTRRVSMVDVARGAAVSQKTVSRVVNGEPHVSQAVRERVLREIERLGYRPNESARALVTRRSRRIGIVTTGTSYFGPAAVLRGLERAARGAGYFVSVVHADEQDEDEARRSVVHLASQGVDGIAVSAPVGVVDPTAYVPAGIPVVRIDPPGPEDAGAMVVGVDNAGGARAATEHLLALGHRTVHHIAGPPGWAVTGDRMRGWRAALRAAGAPEPEPRHGDWSAAAGCRAARELLATTPDPAAAPTAAPTALFVANDQMAIGAMYAIERAGRRVPHDISVVGFDDIPEAGYLSVPLTTVRQDFDAIAGRAMRRLIAAITGARDPGQAAPPDTASAAGPVQLVVRESTAPPPAHRHRPPKTPTPRISATSQQREGRP